ncbi:DUF3089 domain-containing protein [Noviherbaspirillum sp. L7-7A]|uniref:DUF3089 domain-containing protein n=1 Tax=Noviherbaspirillum sp. L7-7A TaxID=2850560 RepID=UPI001C2C22B6|nr:DUF3089 domain-containing protein [Noviherbaspirillum sp. L7-7A]MBV0881577.1 DUF3089 domain-containing protein [Noviherbaspirillum sp. L7-7A]
MRQTTLPIPVGALAAVLLTACGTAPTASTPAPASVATAVPAKSASAGGNDYSDGANWLCLPGSSDACSINLDASLFKPGGEPAGRETFRAAIAPAIDCFYVYPTISNDPMPNSDMIPGPEEKRTVEHQLARFGSECRLFAPVYRQVTIRGLTSHLTGQPMAIDTQMPYLDVLAAWNQYLRLYNNGRGVVLIGHSQGARVLSDLLRQEIEGKPASAQLVSALLIGTNIGVPKGRDVGGTFRQTPLCRAPGQTGCVVSYVSFRDSSPPPANSLFGRLADGNQVACTNPASLAGGPGVLRSYLPTKTNLIGRPHDHTGFAMLARKSDAPFASPQAIARAECVQANNASYLSVTTSPAYTAVGIDIASDLYSGDRIRPEWGTHLVDIELAQGSLIGVVRSQAEAWRARSR